MRPIDADAIPYVDLNGDTPQSKIRVYVAFKERIDKLPTIDTEKHAKWVYKGARGRFPICECSRCGNEENADWAILGDNVNYCPNCGAKMDLQ